MTNKNIRQVMRVTREQKVAGISGRHFFARTIGLMLLGMALIYSPLVSKAALNWPSGQLLPAFSTPAAVIDCVELGTSSSDEVNLFVSLQGIVNRTQPQIACVSSADGANEFTWLNLHNLRYTVLTNRYTAITKYRSYVTGLVVTAPNQPDTINLATTIAGVKDELICAPALLSILTNAPYNLPIVDDLRGRFANKYDVYNYLYANFWSQCTHRLVAGMAPSLAGNFRDYLVAVKAATVYLDPAIPQDATTLLQFVSGIPPAGGLYVGWWPDEGAGMRWIANYGIPVLASDLYRNGSLYGGCREAISVPSLPPPPPLENKVYVAFIVSDGDNLALVQNMNNSDYWGNSARGQVPLSWTTTPLTVDIDPLMLNFYWKTLAANECLISGPSGAGYGHLDFWNSTHLAAFTKLTDGYLRSSGLRVITVWDYLGSGIARAFATNCPTLLGLTDQAATYSAVDLGLRSIRLSPPYSSTVSHLTTEINNAAASWNGSAPLFIAAQVRVWDMKPNDLLAAMNSLDPNKYRFVRADHLFMLANGQSAPPTVNLTTENLIGTANTYPFTPSWSVVTNGDLILGQAPSSSAGNFSLETSGRNVNSLTSGGSLAINQIAGNTASLNYVTCGNGSGAGSSVVYTLNGSANGFNLTNITVFGGWKDGGRDQQAYTIYYSTAAAPTTFIKLATVNYNPASVPANTPSSTRVTLTSVAANGTLAANVAAVKFDFTSPVSENGYCGYAQIAVYGLPSPVITASSQVGAPNTYPFTPGWTVPSSGNLLLGQTPGSSAGNFSLGTYGRNVNSLTSGGSLTINQITGNDTSTNYVTCGSSGGAGWSVVYPLSGSANGYDLTNLTVYGGWKDGGRDQQAYTIYYSTVATPTTFTPLTSVNYNPSVPASCASATRVALTPAAVGGVLAANVAALKFDFTSPISENGYCGYAQIAACGKVSSPLNVIVGTHRIVSAQSGKAIDNGSFTLGSGCVQWEVNNSNNGLQQKWVFTQNPDTSWSISNAYTGLAMEMQAAANGTQAKVWSFNNGSNQRWWVDKQLDGTYKIWNQWSGKALENASSTNNGTAIIQWDWSGGNWQRWNLQ